MLLIILKYFFIFAGSLLTIMLLLGKLYIFKLKDNILVSNYAATIAGLMGVYAVSALLLTLVVPNIAYKVLMLLFAGSPFIIGRFATYEKEILYSFIQIITAFVSVIYVLFF